MTNQTLLERLAAEVLADHVRRYDSGTPQCYHCNGDTWPCPTVALLQLLQLAPPETGRR